MEAQSSAPLAALRQRLLRDIDELTREPYPKITLHVHDGDNLKQACLILDTQGFGTLHLTVSFGDSYPLDPPSVSIETPVSHPNVFGDYICATILNTTEDYTPAYTLKTIAIQLLSFFSSDDIEQDHYGDGGGPRISLADYRRRNTRERGWVGRERGREPWAFRCERCGFGKSVLGAEAAAAAAGAGVAGGNDALPSAAGGTVADPTKCPIDLLPTELLLWVMEVLNPRDLLRFREAWERAEGIAASFDIARIREMICFVSTILPLPSTLLCHFRAVVEVLKAPTCL